MSMTTTYTGVRIVDMPDLGAFSSDSSIVGEHAGSGRFSAAALEAYFSLVIATWSNTGRSLQDRFADAINVRDYGAVADGVTDDTAAIQAAINAAQTAGRRLHFPGTAQFYLTSAALSVVHPLDIGGDYGGAIIKTSSPTQNIFTLASVDVSMHDLKLDATVPRTAGDYVNISSGGDVKIERVVFRNHISGIKLAGSISTIDIANCYFYQPTASTGVGITVSGGVDVAIRGCLMSAAGTSPQPLAGIVINGCGDCTLQDINTVQHYSGLLINPQAGQIVDCVYASDCFFDTSDGYGLQVIPAGTGAVERSRFIGCWFSSHGIDGVILTGTGAIRGMEFHGCHALANGNSGWILGNGSGLTLTGCQAAGNTTAGVSVTAAGLSDFTITGCTLGPYGNFGANGTGLFITTGASDHFIVANNRMYGNTTNQFLNGATGTHTVVTPNLVA